MREYKIYPLYKGDTPAKEKFIRELTERINNDKEIVERSKECNRKFFEQVKKIVNNSENELSTATMINGIKRETPRYSYLKNVEFNGKSYEVEIDELDRVFRLVEM